MESTSEGFAFFGRSDKLLNGSAERGRLAAWNDDRAGSIANDAAKRARIRGNDGQARGHGFENRQHVVDAAIGRFRVGSHEDGRRREMAPSLAGRRRVVEHHAIPEP